ncbi:hypothetical protein LAZ67_5003831 [Cordylochernes scorpioides]|uniref:Uncharacterized protein n=1 Tax=Cordylochernes scorpioides TaxID=51811 RepID=A0ABY6KHV2_9ARAC|nr:hypothetical protein LAZ67_5003831 [Cordylochernes scorpioides]
MLLILYPWIRSPYRVLSAGPAEPSSPPMEAGKASKSRRLLRKRSSVVPSYLSCTLNFLASKEIQTKFEDACTSHPELQPHLLLPQVQPVLEGQRVFKGQALAQQVRNSGFFRHLSNSAVHLDFTPYVRKIMTIENHKIANRRSKRYLHYLDSINIDSSKFRELL